MTSRIADQLVAVLAGLILGVTLMAAMTTTRPMDSSKEPWCPTPRPSQHADPPSGGMTTEPTPGLPSPDVAGRTAAPDNPGVTPAESPQPIGTRPAAATAKPRTSSPPRASLRGTATWFDSPAGVSAAGPALRAAVGPGWRGQRVKVCAGDRCVRTVLGDWCACRTGNRIIDLHAPLFAELAPLSKGVLRVVVRW